MFTSASCVQLRWQPNAMDWEKEMTSTTPKNNIGAYKRSHFSQRTENRGKAQLNQLKILKEQANTLFDDSKGYFLTVGVLPTVTLSKKNVWNRISAIPIHHKRSEGAFSCCNRDLIWLSGICWLLVVRWQSMEWTGSIRWIHNPVQSMRIWIGLDQKFTNSADSGLDWIQKCTMCITYLETWGSVSLS